jgi:DNA helicase-2/ATP-dependent DNA helicase PcrA
VFGADVARAVRAREARAAGREPEARPPVIRRHPGALPDEPHIELDEASPPARGDAWSRGARAPAPARGETYVDYELDQRPEAGRGAFARGQHVLHPSLGAGVVLSCEGPGGEAKVTVRFASVGEKRVLARFLRPAG